MALTEFVRNVQDLSDDGGCYSCSGCAPARPSSDVAASDSAEACSYSAEGPPLQRAGAVIDVMDGLPAALRSRGHEVCVTLPFYREIRENRTLRKRIPGSWSMCRLAIKFTPRGILTGEVPVACSYIWFAATNFSIAMESFRAARSW